VGRLDGKVAIITGTAGGQGRMAALLFAREGAAIVGCDISDSVPGVQRVPAPPESEPAHDVPAEHTAWTEKSQEGTAELVRAAGGRMISLEPCDLTRREDAEALIARAIEEYGRVDILYNNAAQPEWGWFPDLSHETFWACMHQEIDTVFLPTKAVWPHMVAQGGGSIINTGSMSATKVFPSIPGASHMTAKAAVRALSRHLAFEGAAHDIRVNVLSPGLVAAPGTAPRLADTEHIGELLEGHMLKRVGTPQDTAQAALFLASDESSWITGANLAVDGGATAL
jgi:NAD(P)-dependent dehydrogenase (short-subunit alcohol dehydrogenase family)